MGTESGENYEKQESWKPTKEFFETDPRSNEIRNICIEIIKRVKSLQEVDFDSARKAGIYSELETLNGKLIELGVVSEMNVGKPQEYYQSNPVALAEYVAGQLIRATGEDVESEAEIQPLVTEFSEEKAAISEDEDFYLMKTSEMPKRAKKFIVLGSIINMTSQFLDVNEEELHFD